MNKNEIVKQLSSEAGITKIQATKALEAVVHAISDSLHKGEAVTLVGFGTFSVAKRAAREGRNPKTGKIMKIAAKNVAKFKPGKALNEAI